MSNFGNQFQNLISGSKQLLSSMQQGNKPQQQQQQSSASELKDLGEGAIEFEVLKSTKDELVSVYRNCDVFSQEKKDKVVITIMKPDISLADQLEYLEEATQDAIDFTDGESIGLLEKLNKILTIVKYLRNPEAPKGGIK